LPSDYFKKRGYPVLQHFQEIGDQVAMAKAQTVSRQIMDPFLTGDVDEILVLGTRFISAMSRALKMEPFLPIEPPAGKKNPVDYVFEPDAASIFAALVPRYVSNRMVMMLLEASTSEHGSRMVAMGSASRNAKDMIGSLTLMHNRARQAAITKEIAEIVGGAEALK
jgi:F-type H+-transporting ATPase subunit gamma